MGALRNIGKLVSVFGLKGELILHHNLGKRSSLKGLEKIFLEEKKGEWLPYFLIESRAKGNEDICLRLEGIDSKERARVLIRKEVWLSEEDFEKHAGKSAPISWVGFHIIDQGKDLGEILEVLEQTHQTLCRLEIDGKEVLIPLNEEFLTRIERKNKRIHTNLPEGLLDIFLS